MRKQTSNTKLTPDEMKKIIFPPTDRFRDLQMTEVAWYSVTWAHDSKNTCRIIADIMGTQITVLDATACVGGDTINFAQTFSVTAVENDPENFKALVNNIKVFDLSVNCIQGDVCDVKWSGDVFYADPPWGGPSYKDKTSLRLKLGDRPLTDFLKTVEAKLFVFKLPFNYDFEEFKDWSPTLHKYKKRNGEVKFVIVIIKKTN